MKSDDARKAFQCETNFLAGVDSNFESAKGKHFRGTIWQRSQDDDSDRLRALMAASQNFDRSQLKSLPANRRIVLRGFERRFIFGKRATGVAIASVIAPLEHFAASKDGPAPPVGLGELADHVRQLVGSGGAPHVVGVCSPSGFTEEARSASLNMTNVTVVLVEPDGRGGWNTTGSGGSVDARVLRIFDPESAGQKLDRVRTVIERRSADLLTGGVSVSSVARSAGLKEDLVREAFVEVAAKEPELRLTKHDGEFLLYRGAPSHPQENRVMGVVDRIKQLFSREGHETEKINLLAERRAALAQRRDRIYEDICKLEEKEAELFEQGKANKSAVPRRRLAAQLAQLRKDIARQNTTTGMLNQQINIISTDIHNLTLIQQGEVAQLPATEELTENAVKAEEMLESLKADSEMIGSLEVGMRNVSTSDEELAILREFDGLDEASSEPPAKSTAPPKKESTTPTIERPPSEPVAEAPRAREAEKDETTRDADAEPT